MPVYDLTMDNVIDALSDFIEPLCGTCYQAQANRVPSYTGQFCILTPINVTRIGTTKEENADTGDNTTATMGFSEVRQADIQVDIYGDSAGDRAVALETVFRSSYATDRLQSINDKVIPLYSTQALQSPFISAEEQWENRYTITLTIQMQVTISLQQDYFDAVDLSIEKVN